MSRPALAPSRFHPRALASLADDDVHLRSVLDVLDARLAVLSDRLAGLRRSSVPMGAARLQRDLEIAELQAQSTRLHRLGTDVCLGRFDRADGTRTYVGRLGVRDDDGRPLLVDWRTPAAAPFFAATLAAPMEVVRRRRFRWSGGLVVDAWDEWLDLDVEQEQTGLQDAQSAFLASLAAARTSRMTSALATLQADQDAVVRADAGGCTVVDGGPGTGKTVVALHRAAFLAFSGCDPVLYVTRSARLVAYVQDVLPSLGEEDVPVASLAELYADVASRPDGSPALRRLKGDVRMSQALDRAVRVFEDLPDEPVVAQLADRDVVVGPEHWRSARRTCSATEHVALREELLEAVEELLDAPGLAADRAVRAALRRTWPDLTAAQVVRDLLGHRALLGHCAPWLGAQDLDALVADTRGAQGWSPSDLPLLDHAHARLGVPPPAAEPAAELRTRRAAAAAVVDELREAAGEGSALHLLRDTTADGLRPVEDVLEPADAPPAPALSTRLFAHVVVDEAQDLTGMEWAAVLRRCPSRSVTAVGDRAQSREPFDESWAERLAGVGLPGARVRPLRISYRTPAVLLAPAAAVITSARPTVAVPEAVREDGSPLVLERLDDGVDLVEVALRRAAQLVAAAGTAAVVAHPRRHLPSPIRTVMTTPDELQGLEMDAVVVVEPAELWDDDEAAAASLYVTLTRATQAVHVLHARDLPPVAAPLLLPASRRIPA